MGGEKVKGKIRKG